MSKIIKGEELNEAAERPVDRAAPRTSRPGVVHAEVYDAHQEAREIREQAERERQQVVEKAKRDREAAIAEGQKQGYQAGLAQASEIILRAKQQAGAILSRSERQIVELALMIAEKIVGRTLETDPALVLQITANAIESVRNQKELVVRVHPEDGKILREHRKQLMDLLGRTKDIAVREDSEVKRGGCVVETDHGTIDAQLETQMQMLETALLGEPKARAP